VDRYILAEETLSLAEWTSVLKLSAMWQMDRLRQIVVDRMSALGATAEEWTAVLDMSVRQQLLDARTLAIQQLSYYSNIAGVDKILLARKYKVEQWFREGCQELVNRRECFSDEDEDRLGWKTVIKLYRVRDARYSRSHYGYPESGSYEDPIGEEFEAELKDIGWSGQWAEPTGHVAMYVSFYHVVYRLVTYLSIRKAGCVEVS